MATPQPTTRGTGSQGITTPAGVVFAPSSSSNNLTNAQQQQQTSSTTSTGNREKKNWLIHTLYVRQDYDQCLKLIEEAAKKEPLSEYALYLKAMIKRQQGDISESLTLFQQAHQLNPSNLDNLKQIGKSLYLLGKHREAIGIFESAERFVQDDWEIWHCKGVCLTYLQEYERAAECLKRANAISRHDSTYMQLGKLYSIQENYKAAIDVYTEALEFSPENPEILTTLGLLYLRIGGTYKAFDLFGTSLTQNPRNPKTILAAGSIIQDHSEVEVALIKYRIAAVQTPNSPQLWNNVGMCFFGKQKYVAAIASLKRAQYLAPFEWIIAYNLGLVHLHTSQYASAFHFFSAAINLKPDFASSYMYLAITLNKLDDQENACAAYEKALSVESDPLIHLNYAIMLFNRGEIVKARNHFTEFEHLFQSLEEEARNADQDVLEQRALLQQQLA
eukprot:TRINITY_DN1510_c0_g1_i3.p1 TRINITY_DN1510_c0_g1~~TRINITY_DN1510_c0_g1_i3.p1  ORF type:complete len:446 (-),score=106.20 TRINITY_DN1510_c0_g1_i3:95-1432(-)